MLFCKFVYGDQLQCSRPAERGDMYWENHREQFNIIRQVNDHQHRRLPERESLNRHHNRVNDDRANIRSAEEGSRNSDRARKRTTLVESIQSDGLLEGKTRIHDFVPHARDAA